MKKLTADEFISRARVIHKEKYKYTRFIYHHTQTKSVITCPIHGDFIQTPANHLMGFGCRKCAGDQMYQDRKQSKEYFVEKARNTHGDTYTYDNFIYTNNATKSRVTCKNHGDFLVTPQNHMRGCGCPKCKESKGERKVRMILEENNINYIHHKRFPDCRNIYPLSFDFYLPSHSIAIEYQGIQHYKPMGFWNGNKKLDENKHRDTIKREYCLKYNIRLIEIRYDESIHERLIAEGIIPPMVK